MKKNLTYTEKQYIKWWKYNRACKDLKKRDFIFKQLLILNARLGEKQRET